VIEMNQPHQSSYSSESVVSDSFFAVFFQGYSDAVPAIRPIHNTFFGCRLPNDYSIIPTPENVPASPLLISKNVYNLSPIFGETGSFIVNETVRRLVQPNSQVVFRDVVIDRAYWVPYLPGMPEEDFETIGLDPSDQPEHTHDKCLKLFACKAPTERFYAMYTNSTWLHRESYSDMTEMMIGHDAPDGSSVWSRKAYVSRTMIAECGVVFGEAYLFRPDIFELINPYLQRPYFWAKQYRFPTM